MKTRKSALLLLVVLIGVASVFRAPSSKADEAVTVFAAASLTGALSEIARLYENQRGVRIRSVFASSSTLAKQIINGAPADIFISANQDWMTRVEKSGRIEPSSRVSLLANRLSLVVPSSQPQTIVLTEPGSILKALKGGRLAMGDPDHVPAGMYAKAALQSLNLWPALRGRIAAAPDARAALAYVERGEVALGIVYASDTVGRAKISEAAKFPQSTHPAISYPMALISGATGSPVQQLFRFLQSDDARVIFLRHGFSKP